MDGPSTSLATFVTELRYDDVPRDIRELVKAFTIDAVASALAGRHGDEIEQMEQVAESVFGCGRSTVLGGHQTLSSAGAVLLNGYQTTAVAMCDVFRPARCHVAPEVVPPALAIAEQENTDGAALLTAIAAGLETAARVGVAMNYPAMRERGWHPPGIVGPFGGAAAVGRLLQFNVEQQRNAFGLAGSQAAGTFAQWGTATIKFHQARGALSGLLAASLAATGFSAASEILTDPDGGLLHTYSDGGSPELITSGLGSEWRLKEISLRRWPAASPLQTLLTSLFAIVDRQEVEATNVTDVRIAVSKVVYDSHAMVPWTTPSKAQMSIPFLASVALNEHSCWLDHFVPERLVDPLIDDFARRRVQVIADPSLQSGTCVVEIETRDGTIYRDTRSIPKGDPADPLTLDDVADKFRQSAEGILTDAQAADALDALVHLEGLKDVTELCSALRSSIGQVAS